MIIPVSRCLQENVCPSSSDNECRAAKQVNLEFRRCIGIGASLKDPASIPELARRGKGRAANVGEGPVAAHQRIGIVVVRSIRSPMPAPA